MSTSAKDVSKLLELARLREADTRRRESKLQAHRQFILEAAFEGLRITTIQAVLEDSCGLKVSYANLRAWIHRQPEFGKTRQSSSKQRMTKQQLAEWQKLKNRDPNTPLTLTKR